MYLSHLANSVIVTGMSKTGQIYLEFARVGNAMEVRAIDALDGLEVSFMAPVNTPEAEITLISRQKLAYVRKKQAENRAKQEAQEAAKKPDNRRGIIV